MHTYHRRAFSLMETLFAVVIVGLLIAILLPALNLVRRDSVVKQDAANIRGIYIGMVAYSDDNGNTYPKYFSSVDENAMTKGFVPAAAYKQMEFGKNEKDFNDNFTAAMWLMVRGEYLKPSAFVNPATTDTTQPIVNKDGQNITKQDMYDFTSPEHFSYSFTNIYGRTAGVYWTTAVAPNRVVASNNNNGLYGVKAAPNNNALTNSFDKKNTPEQLQEANSKDHDGAGQNVLFADGHTYFAKTVIDDVLLEDNPYSWITRINDDLTRDDSTSLKTLRKKDQKRITATNKDVIQQRYARVESFLLPVESLKQ